MSISVVENWSEEGGTVPKLRLFAFLSHPPSLAEVSFMAQL